MESATTTAPAAVEPEDLEGEGDPTPPEAAAANGNGSEEEEAGSRPSLEITGADQLTFNVGGEPVTDATIKLVGGKVGLRDRAYEKGETVELVMKVRVDEVAFVDIRDGKTNAVQKTERRHKAKVIEVTEL